MLKKVIFSLILLLSSLSLTSQTKVAHIDTYELITNMPEMLEVQKQLEQYTTDRQNEIREMESNLRAKLELYNSEAPEKSDSENKERLEEIQGMEENIRLWMNKVFQDLQKKEQELTAPILEKAMNVIQEVGKENGFDYVLDSTKNQGVILANGVDLMEKVKIKLGF
tara:strand:+ start:895 stop:1395 length:501 start_codon:yes stop_codon:yes gene_type:complete